MQCALFPGLREPIRVLFLVYPGLLTLDLSAPQKVFELASRFQNDQGKQGYDLVIRGAEGELITSSEGITIEVEALSSPSHKVHTVWVLGGGQWPSSLGLSDQDGSIPNAMCASAVPPLRIVGVGAGVFTLAKAGLLDGKRCAIHWTLSQDLATAFPRVRIVPGALFTQDGSIWTGAGATASVDLALALVEADCGRAVTMKIARDLGIYMKRDGNQPQISTALRPELENLRMSDATNIWVSQNLQLTDISLKALANHAGMSIRNFTRTYKRETGDTPSQAVRRIRVAAAARLLGVESIQVNEIVKQCGFLSEKHMANAVTEILSISDADFKKLAADHQIMSGE
jgi:transcriptional regulator GlxA family with amidase domain